jgi:hypothetical protein
VTVSCTGNVDLHAPRLSGADARACSALVRALPSRVAGLARVDADAGDGYGAAWGDPAIELRCGVPTPRGFDRFAGCQNANGVDWFIPESQQTGAPVDVVMTTVGRAQNVEVRVPSAYFPPVEAMVDLAPALKRSVREVKPCV